MQSYLDYSINTLYKNYIHSKKSWKDDEEYIYLRNKTLNLYDNYKKRDKRGLNNRILCLAASFWIVSKLYDDYPYENEQIIEGFDLKKRLLLSTNKLNNWEVKILKSQKWDLKYLSESDI